MLTDSSALFALCSALRKVKDFNWNLVKTLSMYSKQILVLITICNYIKKLGLTSIGLTDLFESQLHFLKMDPAAAV
mgnify:CR=1 FL=1